MGWDDEDDLDEYNRNEADDYRDEFEDDYDYDYDYETKCSFCGEPNCICIEFEDITDPKDQSKYKYKE